MKKALALLTMLLLIAACTTTQPEPTSTPLPPTEPPPPTSTSVPPTQAPNPHAEEVFLALAEALNNQDYAKARTFFSEDITAEFDVNVWGAEDLNNWISKTASLEVTYEFNEFEIAADEVEFKWYSSRYSPDGQVETYKCYARATMEEDKILTLRVLGCAKL